MGPKTFATVRELLWYNYSAVCGSSAQWLYSGAHGDHPQEDLGHMPCLPGLLQPAPLSLWQATADPCLCRRPSNTPRQIDLAQSLVEVTAPFPGSWCTQGFVCTLQTFLVCMRFDFKCDCTPPTVFLGLLLCPWMEGIFFWWDTTSFC